MIRLSGEQPDISERARLLAGVALFAGLERVALAKLAAHLEAITVEAGEVLMRQGEPGDAFFLVAKGSFGIYVAGEGGVDAVRVGTLVPGDPMGEMALLTNSPRTATVIADSDGEVLRLDRVRFLDLVNREPGVALAIATALSRRLARLHPRATLEGAGAPPVGAAATAPATRTERPGGPIRTPWRPSRSVVGVALTLLVMLAGLALPPPAGLSIEGWLAVATLGALVPALALNAIPEGILALLLAAVWVLAGIAPPDRVLAGYASASWVLVVSVLVIGAGVGASGLLYRMASWAVAHTRRGFSREVLALGLGGVLIGPAVPNATARMALVAPAVAELVEALGHAPRSRQAAGLAMAALVGFGQMAAVFLTSSTTAVLVFAVLPSEVRHELNWVSWAVFAAVPNLLLLAGLVVTISWLYRPQAHDMAAVTQRAAALALQRALLGPPSRNERACLWVGVFMLLGFVTQPLHGTHPGWIAAVAVGLLSVTGAVTADTLRSVNWSFALYFGMLAGIPEVFSRLAVDGWLAGWLSPVVAALANSPLLLVAALAGLAVVATLVLRWQAAAPLLTLAFAPTAAQAGIDPLVVGLTVLIAGNGFLFPYQSTNYLALYEGTNGRLFSHAQARPAAVAYTVLAFAALCASVPAWRWMGLL